METLSPILLEYKYLIFVLFLVVSLSIYLQGTKWFYPLGFIINCFIGSLLITTAILLGLLFGASFIPFINETGIVIGDRTISVENTQDGIITLALFLVPGSLLIMIAHTVKPMKKK